MYKRHASLLPGLLITMVAIIGSSAYQPAWARDNHAAAGGANGVPGQQNTLKQAQNEAAAIRKSKGRMRSTTNDDRWTAAIHHADRHAAAVAQGKEGGRK